MTRTGATNKLAVGIEEGEAYEQTARNCALRDLGDRRLRDQRRRDHVDDAFQSARGSGGAGRRGDRDGTDPLGIAGAEHDRAPGGHDLARLCDRIGDRQLCHPARDGASGNDGGGHARVEPADDPGQYFRTLFPLVAAIDGVAGKTGIQSLTGP